MHSKFTPEIQADIRDGIKFGLGAERVIFKYVRNKHRQRIGICIAMKGNKCGWAKCALKKGDKFDRPAGYELAIRRALIDRRNEDGTPKTKIPSDVNKVLEELSGRAKAYFKE